MNTRRWIALAGAGLTWGLVAIGCGSSTSGGSAGTVSEQDYPAALAHALCDNIEGCCQKANYAYNDAQCVAREIAATYPYPPPNSHFNAQQAGACIALYASMAKSCSISAAETEKADSVCGAVFTGTKAAGEACQYDSECAPPSGGAAFCDTGVCVAATRAKAGDACIASCVELAGILLCRSGASGSLRGGACFTSDGLYCSSQGQCAALAGAGQSCTEAPCAASAYCDPTTHICRAYAAIGADCGQGQQCAPNATCGPTGKCEARSALSIATPDKCSGLGSGGSSGDAGP